MYVGGKLMNPDVYEMKPCWRGITVKQEINSCPKVPKDANVPKEQRVYEAYEPLERPDG